MVEPLRGKIEKILGVHPIDLELFDQRKRTGLVSIRVYVLAPGLNGKGVVEVGSGGRVLKVASNGLV